MINFIRKLAMISRFVIFLQKFQQWQVLAMQEISRHAYFRCSMCMSSMSFEEMRTDGNGSEGYLLIYLFLYLASFLFFSENAWTLIYDTVEVKGIKYISHCFKPKKVLNGWEKKLLFRHFSYKQTSFNCHIFIWMVLRLFLAFLIACKLSNLHISYHR